MQEKIDEALTFIKNNPDKALENSREKLVILNTLLNCTLEDVISVMEEILNDELKALDKYKCIYFHGRDTQNTN